MSVSLKDRLLKYLESRNEWIPKEEIIQTAKTAYEAEKKGLSSEYVGRTLRQLAEEGKIQSSLYKGKKGQDLVKYSALKVEKETKPQMLVEIITLSDGSIIAKTI